MPGHPDTELSAGNPASVAILGLGLIGGSVGLALRGKVRRIVGWDLNPNVAGRALERGAIGLIAQSSQAAVADAEVVFLCAPLHTTISLLSEIAPVLPQGSTVTDIGSVKGPIVQGAEAIIGGSFVGGHPMAGSDQHGIEAAGADLFQSACWFLTPTDRTGTSHLARVETLVRSMDATPRRCDSAEHDRLVSALSHLPHVLAFGLAQTAADLVPAEWRASAAGSFRDGSRVAGSNPELWRTVFPMNRENILVALDRFDGWTSELRRAIMDGDEDKLRAILEHAHNSKDMFSTGR